MPDSIDLAQFMISPLCTLLFICPKNLVLYVNFGV